MGNATSRSAYAGNETFLTTAREPLLGLLDKLDEKENLEVLGKQTKRQRPSKRESNNSVGRSVVYKGELPTKLLQGHGKGITSNDDVSDTNVRSKIDVSAMTTVAIKRLRLGEETGGREDYWKEVHILSEIRHPRLVQLLGCCSEKGEALLIYEFMEGGALGPALLNPVSSRGVLTWQQRLTIALDAARGLEWLHARGIYHRDFRPDTVFLDKNNCAKVGGLSCAYATVPGTSPPPDQKVVGRIGYVCPTYLETGQISSKLDVFSFGITLLQLLSGKMTIMHSADSGQTISLAQIIEKPELDLLPPALRELKAQEASEEVALDTFANLAKMRAHLAPIIAEAERQKAENSAKRDQQEAQQGEVEFLKALRKSGRGADAYHKLECIDDDVALDDREMGHRGGEEKGGVGGGWGVGGEGRLVGHGMQPKVGGSRKGGHWALENEEGGVSDVDEFEEGLEESLGVNRDEEICSFEDFMDPRLVGEYDEEVSRKVVALAAECVQRRPSGRPEMGEVVTRLERLLEDAKG